MKYLVSNMVKNSGNIQKRLYANMININGVNEIDVKKYFSNKEKQSEMVSDVNRRSQLLSLQLLEKYKNLHVTYDKLHEINHKANAEYLNKHYGDISASERENILNQTKLNMHGAIRVPNEEVYHKFFKLMNEFFGMEPHGIYNFLKLGKDALPVRATALRSPGLATQIFYSLVALDNIPEDIRKIYLKHTLGTEIFPQDLQNLIDKFYQEKNLSIDEEKQLIDQLTTYLMKDRTYPEMRAMEWILAHEENIKNLSPKGQGIINNLKVVKAGMADISLNKQEDVEQIVNLINEVTELYQESGMEAEYLKNVITLEEFEKVKKISPYLADLMVREGELCINHLTPTAFWIDEALKRMQEFTGMIPLQGPDPSLYGYLVELQQMSNKAFSVPLVLVDQNGKFIVHAHTPQFIEFEKRGVALTGKGREMEPQEFRGKTMLELARDGLIHYHYVNNFSEGKVRRLLNNVNIKNSDYSILDYLISSECVVVNATIYEGFLSQSARNIFKSTGNVGEVMGSDGTIEEKSSDDYAYSYLTGIIKKPIKDEDVQAEIFNITSAINVLGEFVNYVSNKEIKTRVYQEIIALDKKLDIYIQKGVIKNDDGITL